MKIKTCQILWVMFLFMAQTKALDEGDQVSRMNTTTKLQSYKERCCVWFVVHFKELEEEGEEKEEVSVRRFSSYT